MSSQITIDPEFRDLIPPLQPEELEQLHNSLCGDGCLHPLIVWKDEGILIDGHNRYAWLTEHDRPFEIKEMAFSSREVAKRFIILNQLGRRNVTPETASMLRAQYHESMNRGRGGARNPDGLGGRSGKTLSNHQSDGLTNPEESTAELVAKQTGASKATVERDARLAKALDALGISRNDYAAGKVLDADGKKRSKKSIIEEAFPPKVKTKKQPPAEAAPTSTATEPTEVNPPLASSIVIEDEESYTAQPTEPEPQLQPWTIILLQIPKINKGQRQQLHDLLETKWDCEPRQ
jgi:hypothetical protein